MMLLGCVASQTAGDVPANGYPLDDDGTNAASFGQSWLETIAPARLRAQYTTTGTTGPLVALPAVINAAPGLVTLTEGVPRVCGFKINALPTAGNLNEFYLAVYNLGGAGSVLVNAAVTKNNDATTGTIKGQSGTFPPSVADFGSTYTGSLIGAKIAIQVTLASGLLTAKLFVNGSILGTSTGIATDGGIIGLMQIIDGAGTAAGGVVDIECVPTISDGLDNSYGAFSENAIDMIDNVIP